LHELIETPPLFLIENALSNTETVNHKGAQHNI
jgi:hypothetical protein